MGKAVVILLVATALAGLVKVLSERIGWLKRWSWYVAVFIEAAGVVFAITEYFKKEPPPLTKEEVIKALCEWDQYKRKVSDLPGKEEISVEEKEELEEAAKCLADIAITSFDSGLVAIGLRDYDKAITHLNYAIQAAQDDSSETKAFFYMGVTQHLWAQELSTSVQHDGAKVKCENALSSYDSALSYKHDYQEAWNNRGVALRELERYDEAIASYDSALSYKHDLHEAWNNRGNALSDLERYQEAIASYDSALSYKHDLHKTWNNRGSALDRLGRYEEALVSTDSALKYNPASPHAWDTRCVVLRNLGRYKEAVASCDSAVKYSPEDPLYWFNRSLPLRELGLVEEALASCDSALKYDPNDIEAAELRKAILEEMNK